MARPTAVRAYRIRAITLLAMLAMAVAHPAAGASLQRFVLAAGANNGGKDRGPFVMPSRMHSSSHE